MNVDEMQKTHLLKEWESYNRGFFSCDGWINMIAQNLIYRSEMDSDISVQKQYLKEPYLGQKPPGMTPEIFAPGFISQAGMELHSSLTISKNGKEIYFTRLEREEESFRNVIMCVKYHHGKWFAPEVAPFSGKFNDTNVSISADGKFLFFSSNRPLEKGGKIKKDRDIWTMEKRNDGWGEPSHLKGLVNSDFTEDAVSVSRNGTMYFYRKCEKDEGWGEILRSRFIGGVWSEPERLGASINTKSFECFPVIAPDESYLIFYRLNRLEDTGQYICFKMDEGAWTTPINMGEVINGGAVTFCSSISPDGKYLFFLRRRNDSFIKSQEDFKEGVYWINAKIIEELKPTE
jgi:hypothetical protein